MKKLVIAAVALVVVTSGAFATPLVGRSATVNKPLQLFGWLNFGYNQTAMKYNWASSAWETPDGFVPLKTTSCDVTAAIGLPGKVDIDVVAPLAMKEAGSFKSTGLGDVMVYARYGLLQSSLLPVKAALILGANLPTADKAANPAIGDRTTDIGVAVSVNTQKYFGLVAHARAGYWLNGKLPDTDKKVGNMFEYLLDADYSLTKTLTPQLAVSGYSRAQTDSSGTSLVNTEVSQHVVNVLLMWKPISILVIRPKVAFPLTFMSKGGSMANVYGGLDVWATIP
jgi:hypothetical protein